MSALSRQSLGSAQMKPFSREKDDCKSKTCKEYNIIILLTFVSYKFGVELNSVVNTNKDVIWHTI